MGIEKSPMIRNLIYYISRLHQTYFAGMMIDLSPAGSNSLKAPLANSALSRMASSCQRMQFLREG